MKANQFKVIESKHWRNVLTGQTASLLGPLPYRDNGHDWIIETTGWTVYNENNNTVGIGRQPWKTREEAEAWIKAGEQRA